MKLVSTSTELDVLRSMCSKDPAVAGTLLAGVDEDYFYSEWTKSTYHRIKEENKRTGELVSWRDVITDPELSEKIRTRLKESNAYRFHNTKEAQRALNRLNQYRQLRGIFDISESSVNELRKKKVKPSDMLDIIATRVTQLRQVKQVENDMLVFGKGNNSTKFVKEMMEAETQDYLPTGFKDFDAENQGFGFGNLVVIAGTTGGGKSALAAQLGYNWADMGEDVDFVPLEMTKKEMASRIMANASGIDVRKILFGKMSKDEKKVYWKAYKKMVLGRKKTGGSFRIFKPRSDMTIEEILASTYMSGSRVVIIDYISLLKGVDGDDAWQKLGAVARYCKIYAETHNKIIVLLAQLSEEGMIRYAKAIAEHANYLWKFVTTATTRELEILNIEQGKARNGRIFDFTLKANMNTMRIRDMEEEEKDEIQNHKRAGKTSKGKDGRDNKFKGGKPQKGKERQEAHPKKKSKSYLKDLADEDDDDE